MTIQKVVHSDFVVKTKSKIEENKVAQKIGETSTKIFNFIVDNGKKVGSKVDEKIDKNPKLHKALDLTKEGICKTSKTVEKGFSKFMVKLGLMKKADRPQHVGDGNFVEVDVSNQPTTLLPQENQPVDHNEVHYAINDTRSEGGESQENHFKNYQ